MGRSLPRISAGLRVGLSLLAIFAIAPTTARAGDTVELAGTWAFRLDPADEGLDGRWWTTPLPDRLQLPGTLQSQGFGDPVGVGTAWTGQIVDRSWFTDPRYEPYREPGQVKVPFWLQPDRHYVGPAWYQRTVTVPAAWADRRVQLDLERPHWETRVWIDDRAAGIEDGLSTPHLHDLGRLAPGEHRLTVRVDNRLVVDVGVNSHSVSDHTQGNWNGIVGRIELAATPLVRIGDLQVDPDASARAVVVRGRIDAAEATDGQGTLDLAIIAPGQAEASRHEHRSVSWSAQGGTFETRISLGPDAPLWDEFHPALYRLEARLDGGDVRNTTFGLRTLATQGTEFRLNGRPLFLRGTLECCIFPLTGHPPTDVPSWKRIIGIAKAHGLNHIRFHSYCPPEAAFVAADELGFYYQVECASWANQSTTLGDGKPVDAWIERETERIVQAYGNHPSFLLLAYGNEPGGEHYTAYLERWVERWKHGDPRRLYTSASGWPQIAPNQFHVTPDPRIQAWGQGLGSRINAAPPETRTDYRDYVRARSVPVVSHEIGQWCVYPDLEEAARYTGPLRARNFEIFRDSLAAHGLLDQARDFLHASGKLQALCYKEEIESALRTPGMGGFQLLALQDFPGQGTALVGVLDPMWNTKGYIEPADFRRFCGPTVPLARLARRVFTTAESLEADLEIAHHGPDPLAAARPYVRLVDDDGTVVHSETLPPRDLAIGGAQSLGSIRVPLASVHAPARLRLVVGLEQTGIENDWDLWVYPPTAPPEAPGVVVATGLDEALQALGEGRTVVWTIPAAEVRNDSGEPVALGFSSIFWNTAWTHRQPPTTLGLLCDPHHPALGAFPTDPHSNWQWWYPLHRAAPMILDGLPGRLRPIVQVIDDWVTNRRLGLVIEARVGPGQLLATSIDLRDSPALDPVTRQLRASLLRYAASGRFHPDVTLTPAQLRTLIR